MVGAEDFLGDPDDLDSIFEDLGIKPDLNDSPEKKENNLEKISETKESLNPQIIQNNNTLQNQGQIVNGYIYVPAIDLYVAKKPLFQGNNLNWYRSHEELKKINLRMPTINEFRFFLSYLLSNPNGTPDASTSEISDILSKMFDWSQKGCLGEWLDAKFSYENGKLFISQYHTYINGELVPRQKKPLDKCLLDKKFNKIDTLQWLDDASIDGLPKEGISVGDLDYECPQINFFQRLFRTTTTAMFRADPYVYKNKLDAIFECNCSPKDTYCWQVVRGCVESRYVNGGKIN